MGPHCVFCGTSTGPFQQIEGLFTLLMCTGCQAARRTKPLELLADFDQGRARFHWGCVLCAYRAIEPEALEVHTALPRAASACRVPGCRGPAAS
jgi:hypothetical protein